MQYKSLIFILVTPFCMGLAGLQAQTVKDADGNVYKTVTIGAQLWMAENLKTTKYNDGTDIPLVPDDQAWGASTGKLREAGTTHWEKPNNGATNGSGFTTLPGGYRNNHGAFANVGFFGFWWTATENVPTASWCRTMGCASVDVLRIFSLKKNGYSVRCIKD
jgi:hypothetical protein